jgi:hypothetical protein
MRTAVPGPERFDVHDCAAPVPCTDHGGRQLMLVAPGLCLGEGKTPFGNVGGLGTAQRRRFALA